MKKKKSGIVLWTCNDLSSRKENEEQMDGDKTQRDKKKKYEWMNHSCTSITKNICLRRKSDERIKWGSFSVRERFIQIVWSTKWMIYFGRMTFSSSYCLSMFIKLTGNCKKKKKYEKEEWNAYDRMNWWHPHIEVNGKEKENEKKKKKSVWISVNQPIGLYSFKMQILPQNRNR